MQKKKAGIYKKISFMIIAVMLLANLSLCVFSHEAEANGMEDMLMHGQNNGYNSNVIEDGNSGKDGTVLPCCQNLIDMQKGAGNIERQGYGGKILSGDFLIKTEDFTDQKLHSELAENASWHSPPEEKYLSSIVKIE